METPAYKSVRNVQNGELMTGMGCYSIGIRGGVGYVALCWTAKRPDMLQAYGPFKNKTEAMAFGRENYPRRYKVAGVNDPSTVNFYYKG